MYSIYLDESGHESGGHVVIAGFLGNDEQWASFHPEWRRGVGSNSFHIKDVRWSKDSTRLRLASLGAIPHQHGLRAVVGAVNVADYSDLLVNTAEIYTTQGYLMALFPILSAVSYFVPPASEISWTFEEQHDYEQPTRTVFRNFATLQGHRRYSKLSFVPKKTEPLLQPADFLSYAILQRLRNPGSKRAQWCSPIIGNEPYLGAVADRDTIREILGPCLQGAAAIEIRHTGRNPREVFKRYKSKREIHEVLRKQVELRYPSNESQT